jgi:hypothetical protein
MKRRRHLQIRRIRGGFFLFATLAVVGDGSHFDIFRV